MDNHFSFLIDDPFLDLPLSVSCGQVFRWRTLPSGRLLGVDGDSWWVVDGRNVDSNRPSSFFADYFRLDDDWSANAKSVRELAPELSPLIDLLPGLRLLRVTDTVEETISFACTSNNSLHRIYGMVGHLAKKGMVQCSVEGIAVHRFPDLDVLAGITEGELRQHKFGYRAKTIPTLATQIIARGGRSWLESLKRTAYREARSELLGLDGIGPKLADCICLFALDLGEAVPIDTHVWQAACRLWFPELSGLSLTQRRYELVQGKLVGRLGKLAGWAHQFLFFHNHLGSKTRPAGFGPPPASPGNVRT